MTFTEELITDCIDGKNGDLDSWEEPEVFGKAATALQEMQQRIAELEADLDALHKWPTWKEQCDHIHALTNERLRLDAALGEIKGDDKIKTCAEFYRAMIIQKIIDKARAGD